MSRYNAMRIEYLKQLFVIKVVNIFTRMPKAFNVTRWFLSLFTALRAPSLPASSAMNKTTATGLRHTHKTCQFLAYFNKMTPT